MDRHVSRLADFEPVGDDSGIGRGASIPFADRREDGDPQSDLRRVCGSLTAASRATPISSGVAEPHTACNRHESEYRPRTAR